MKANAKKLCFIFLILPLLCLAVPAAGVSADEPASEFELSLTANKSEVGAGEAVTITVSAENISAAGGLLSIDIPFRFDTSVFEFVRETAHFPSVWRNPADFSYKKPKGDGLLWLRMLNDGSVFSSAAGCTEDGAMSFDVTLIVKIGAAPGAGRVTVSGDGGFEVVSGTCADGMCTAAYGTGTSLELSVIDKPHIKGDVNGDGAVDNLDASIILKYDAGLSNLSPTQKALADVSDDGIADNMDAARILKFDAGLTEGF